MSLKRKAIRQAVVDGLIATGVVDTRVFKNRSTALSQTELPAINVLTARDRGEPVQESPRYHEVTLDLQVEVVGLEVDSVDDELDTLAEVPLRWLLSDPPELRELLSDLIYRGTELTSSAEGDAEIAGLRLTFEVTYQEEAGQTVAPTLTSTNVQIDVGPEPDGSIESEDELP